MTSTPQRVSIVLPARDEAATIGPICRALAGAADELVVIDGGSRDDTGRIAAEAGATVVRAAEVFPALGPSKGKGDSLWRSLAVTSGDIVVWLDADVLDFDAAFVAKLVEPLLADERLVFTKGHYLRPFGDEPDGGGRVTELLARPLLTLAFPELGGFLQPLAGEYAGRREALERIAFRTGYSVEVAMLIDLALAEGLDALAQVDLGERRHRNRPLRELAPMAHAIARTIVERAERHGRLLNFDAFPRALVRDGARLVDAGIDEIERSPMASVRAQADT